ncbi:MAG TPA: c-type cytochrome [Verrucomicrobiae bacterium]|nr:c-type cytochrome [Verrucomicrobiae bacterium]
MSAIQSLAVAILILILCGLPQSLLAASPNFKQQQQAGPGAQADLDVGRQAYVANCSRCHGLYATGGDGPNIQRAPITLGNDGVIKIIKDGVPGTMMTAFNLDDAQIAAIIAYIRSLGRRNEPAMPTRGDKLKGQAVYDGNGCSGCHTIDGQGGSLGPELTQIGSLRQPDMLRQTLLDPGNALPTTRPNRDRGKWLLYTIFRAVQKDGRVVEGMRVSESTFAIVLEDAKGNFHSLSKANLRSLEKEPGKTYMPSFKDTLSAAQVDDIVAYLSSLRDSSDLRNTQ